MAAPASLSDEDVRALLKEWKDLDPEHVDLYVLSGVGRTLLRLERSGFQCSEEALLLLLCPDPSNYEASMAYLHGGNFALPPGTPGQQPWPDQVADGTVLTDLPSGVDAAPPSALGRFLVERFPSAVDMTGGTTMDVIYLPDTEVFSNMALAALNSDQFARRGPVSAKQAGTPVEPQLVRPFVLTEVNGRPNIQRHFTMA